MSTAPQASSAVEEAWSQFAAQGWVLSHFDPVTGRVVADYRLGGAALHVDGDSLEQLCQRIEDWRSTRAAAGLGPPGPVPVEQSAAVAEAVAEPVAEDTAVEAVL